MALATVVMAQIGNLFARTAGNYFCVADPLLSNRLLWIGIATEIALLSLKYLSLFWPMFGMQPFPPANWLFLLLWIPMLVLADTLWKVLVRRLRRTGCAERR